MFLSSLRLISFRNHHDSLFDTRRRKVILIGGQNGAGKTSVLEAIHLLATGIGFRSRRDSDFIRFEADGYRIDARADGWDAGIRCRKGSRREAFLGGSTLPRWTDLIGRIKMTALRPEDLALVEGAPAERRRYLDIMLCQQNRAYFDGLSRWRRAMKQRQKSDPRHRAVSASFDALVLAELPRIFSMRAKACIALDHSLRELHQALALPGTPGLEYKPAIPSKFEPGDWENAARFCHRESRRCEQMGQPSPWGPSRDEVVLTLDGMLLRQFGSQGQKRLVSLLLRLAEAQFLAADGRITLSERVGGEAVVAAGDDAPLVLVDDVFGELDANRKNAFLGLLSAVSGQLWIADTDVKNYEERFQNHAKFDIKSGTIQGAIYP